MKRLFLILALACSTLFVGAQVPCDSVESIFRKWNTRLDELNAEDPEIITLHYLFLQDVRREMDRFRSKTLPTLPHCISTDYYLVKSHFQKVAYKAEQMEQLLGTRKGIVDRIFYERAVEELHYGDTVNALYNLDRALEFNRYQPEALLLKAKLELDRQQYKEAVDNIHLLYTKAELDEQQERDVSDFTLVLYDRLYNTGSALIKSGHSADALELFLALEQFCTNMPSGYCNDDYYHGILLSREGVYESYIAIAKEAERRHNMEMARKFYQYAEEYRNNK